MQAFPSAAVLVVHVKWNGLPVCHRAAALLYWLSAALRSGRNIERAIESAFIGSDGERASVGRVRYGTHAEPVDDSVGKTGGRTGVRKHIHDQDEMPRALGTREREDVRDVSDWVGDSARSGDVVRHVLTFPRLPHSSRPTNST